LQQENIDLNAYKQGVQDGKKIDTYRKRIE
jgi:hypothetical protein